MTHTFQTQNGVGQGYIAGFTMIGPSVRLSLLYPKNLVV